MIWVVGVAVAVAAAPQEYENQSEKHAAEVCEMSNVIGTEEAFIQFNDSVADYEPLGLDGHQEIEIDAFVWEHHAEGKKDAIDGTGGPNGWNGRHVEGEAHGHVCGCGTKAASKIIGDEALGAPIVFQDVAEHPESEHVEEDVPDTGMQEHIGEGLPETEESGFDRPEAEHVGDLYVAEAFDNVYGDESQDIDNDKMLDTFWEHRETLRGILGHRRWMC